MGTIITQVRFNRTVIYVSVKLSTNKDENAHRFALSGEILERAKNNKYNLNQYIPLLEVKKQIKLDRFRQKQYEKRGTIY